MFSYIKKSMKLASTFSYRYQFSVLFLQRQYTISPYDNLITDINEEDLKNQISIQLNKQYLSQLKQNEKQVEQKRMGIIYGKSGRGLISIPTAFYKKNPIWIHYLIVTGSPSTYLTQEAMRALTSPSHQIRGPLLVNINGQKIVVNKSSYNFQDVNILGMDYLLNRKSLMYHIIQVGKNQHLVWKFSFDIRNHLYLQYLYIVNMRLITVVNMIVRGTAIMGEQIVYQKVINLLLN